jgi:hypothetical protein
MAVEPGSPDFWLQRLLQCLGEKQDRTEELDKYARGEHPPPDGDQRYVKALKELQQRATTNYVGLVLKAVTQRMRVKEFKFNGEVDEDAGRIWKANHMELQSAIAINDAAKFSESYALVSPPDDEDPDIPIITIEDPRCCVVENDPVRPLRRLAGLKAYVDPVIEATVVVLYLPDHIYVYHGQYPGQGHVDFCHLADRIRSVGSSAAGLELVDDFDNPLGEVCLIRGVWRPEDNLGELEDGVLAIQDRINHTMLARLIITKAQAYRQRLVSGVKIPKDGPNKGRPPFDPGADMLWVLENENSKVWDLDQADIKQLLDAIRDDIADMAALTQTPITYLTSQISNVSGDTLQAAQHSHVAKVRRRQDAMGWYFEAIIKTCFRYMNDPRAKAYDAEVYWQDPEVRMMSEMADMVAKFNDVIPLELIMERAGFTADEIKRAVQQIEEERNRQQQRQLELAEKEAQIRAAGSRVKTRSPETSSSGSAK